MVLLLGLLLPVTGSVMAQSSVMQFDPHVKDWQENLQTFQDAYQNSKSVISGLNQEIANLNSRFKEASNPLEKETLRRELNEALSSLTVVLLGTFGQLDSLRNQVLDAGDLALEHLNKDQQGNVEWILEIKSQLSEIEHAINEVNAQYEILESIAINYSGSTLISQAADDLRQMQAQVMQGHLRDLPAQYQRLSRTYERLQAGAGHNSAILERAITTFAYQSSWIPIKKQVYEVYARLGLWSSETQLILDEIFAPLLEIKDFGGFVELTSESDDLIWGTMDEDCPSMLPAIGPYEELYNNQHRGEESSESPLLVEPAMVNMENGVDLNSALNGRD